MRYILIIAAIFCSLPQISAQNNITYGAGISYTNGAPSFTPPARTSRVAIDTITGKWYHYNTPGGWQLLGNTIEEIAGCSAPAYTPTKGDSKVVINNCTAPELYYWTGSAWVWINEGTTYYAGEGIRIQNDSIILDSLYYLQFRTGDTTDLNAGRLSWNAQEGTLDVVINSGNVTGQVFEDVFFNCKNQTGSTITRGTVVMAVGTLGASGRILIAPAIADGSVNSEYILGTAAQDIANGADGLVYHFGKDRDLNTTGASCGETWADRDVLYCSATTPGCLTKTIPTAPNLKVPVAIVLNAAANGTIFVRPSHFPDLNQINDVQITSPTTGQTLIYNSVTGVWSNQTPADPSPTNELQTLSVATNTATLSNGGGSVTIAGAGINTVGTAGATITVTGTEVDGSVSNELQTLSTGTNTLTLSNGGGTVTVDTDPASDITGSGVSGRVPYFNGTQTVTSSSNFLYDNSGNGRLSVGGSGIGTLNLMSTGENYFYQDCYNSIGGVSNYWLVRRSRGTTIGTRITTENDDYLGVLYFQGVNNLSAFEYGARIFARQAGTAGTFVPTRLSLFTNSSTGANNNQLNLQPDGNVSIGTIASAAKVHVVGSGSTSTTWTAQFHNSAGNNNALMIRDDGNVGIGTSTPIDKLHVTGAIRSSVSGAFVNYTAYNAAGGYPRGQMIIGNNTSDVNAGLSVSPNEDNKPVFLETTTYKNLLSTSNKVFRIETNSSASLLVSYAALGRPIDPVGNPIYIATRGDNATTIPAIFINNTNNQQVGINTPTPNASAQLEINSTNRGVLFPRMTTAQRNLISAPADGLVIYNTTDNKLQVRAAGAWVDLH